MYCRKRWMRVKCVELQFQYNRFALVSGRVSMAECFLLINRHHAHAIAFTKTAYFPITISMFISRLFVG